MVERSSRVLRRVAIEILPRHQQALHQERSFRHVAAIVVLAKARNYFAGAPIQKMRPDAVKRVGIRKKMRDFLQPLYALFAGDEFSRNAHDNGHNSESRRSQRHQILSPGRISMAMPALGCAASQ